MDYQVARFNMIEQQIRPWNVLQVQTLNALGEIRREDFVPEQYKGLSFADMCIPIGDGQLMLEPKVGARMIEAMALNSSHRVLEIGTGSGYLTALLATICEHVTSVEIDQQLAHQAGINLAMAGITNVELVKGDGFTFCGDATEQFDRVLITGSMHEIDKVFRNITNINGRVVGIEGHDPAMQAVVYGVDEDANKGANEFRQSLFETSVPRLINAEDKPTFTF